MTESDYNECVNRNADAVYRFILKNIRNEADAEDIVQSAFEKLWELRKEVLAEKSKSFLFTIAYRRMVDLMRKNSRIQLKESFGEDEQQALPAVAGIKEALNRALETLTEIKKAVVLLKDYEGYSYNEIGQITGLSESQVKVYIHRARIELRDYLIKIENVV